MNRTPPEPPPERPPLSVPVRVLLVGGGTLALVLGAVGVVLPLLPTTPFVLLAAGCYARAWAPAHRWLRKNRFFGPICRSGVEGRYLPPRAKAVAVGLTVLSFGATISFAVASWPLRIVLALLGLAVTTWLARLPTRPATAPSPVHPDAEPVRDGSAPR